MHSSLGILTFVSLLLSCSSSGGDPGDTARFIDASSPQSCDDQRTAFVGALTAMGSCVADVDCVVYTAHCVQADSGNCAGFFYLDKARITKLDGLRADLEACSDALCNPGPTCGLGPLTPKCISGQCVGMQVP